MAAKIGGVLIDVAADVSKLVEGMTKAQQTVDRTASNIKSSLGPLAGIISGIVSVSAMKNIIDKTNGLNIALAQSVEQNINQGEAYSSLDHTDFINAVQKIEQELNHIGLKAIYIQSWEDYKRGD